MVVLFPFFFCMHLCCFSKSVQSCLLTLLCHLSLCLLCCCACSPVLMCPLSPCFVLPGFWFVLSFAFILYFFPWTFLCRLFVVCILGYGLWALDISSLFCLPACLCVCIWVLAIFAKLNILYLNPTRAKGQKSFNISVVWGNVLCQHLFWWQYDFSSAHLPSPVVAPLVSIKSSGTIWRFFGSYYISLQLQASVILKLTSAVHSRILGMSLNISEKYHPEAFHSWIHEFMRKLWGEKVTKRGRREKDNVNGHISKQSGGSLEI